jgi:hypothetical protein
MMRVLLVFVVLLFDCAKQPAPPHVADSGQTANTVQQMHGKAMRTFRGPADILGDTTKNARKPPMVKLK